MSHDLARLIREVPDYPRPGVVFRDITPLLASAGAFAASVDALVDISPADVLAHMSRHLLGWIDAWQEHGGAALTREISLRLPHGAVAA